jgi:hypothetical protein
MRKLAACSAFASASGDNPMKNLWRLLIFATSVVFAGAAAADEREFLKSLEGAWSGGGTVKLRINSSPINVSCSFDSKENDNDLSMQGTCRGMVLVTRSVGADLTVNGGRYSGTYIGPEGARSGLSGTRQGDAINLAIRWSKEVNGDRVASLTLQKVGSNGMMLRTTDVDPKSGKPVVTSEISLQRK